MSDFKVVLPATTEEWQRDMNIAYNQALEDFVNKLCSLRKYNNDLNLNDLIEVKKKLTR